MDGYWSVDGGTGGDPMAGLWTHTEWAPGAIDGLRWGGCCKRGAGIGYMANWVMQLDGLGANSLSFPRGL